MSFGKMVDMALEPKKESKDTSMAYPCSPESGQPIYPWGLCISLQDEQLEKLGLDADCEVGDLLDMRCMARVTSVSQNETTNGKCSRVELQVIMMGVEDEGSEEDEVALPVRRFRPLSYKK